MALVTALELGVVVENRLITVTSAEWLDAINPLRQIPTLLLGDGRVVFDSRVICAYFATLAPASGIVSSDVHVQTRWALVLGLMEATVSRQMERNRPDGEWSPKAIARAEQRISGGIVHLEAEAEEICDGFDRIDRIATAAALDYIDFRYPHTWRHAAPRLGSWLDMVRERPSMASTRPR